MKQIGPLLSFVSFIYYSMLNYKLKISTKKKDVSLRLSYFEDIFVVQYCNELWSVSLERESDSMSIIVSLVLSSSLAF